MLEYEIKYHNAGCHLRVYFSSPEVGNRSGTFSLATVFPRREFTADDLDKTLLALELAPSASIVLLPVSELPISLCKLLLILMTTGI